MRSLRPSLRLLAVVAFAGVGASAACAQLAPEAGQPVRDFRLPFFGEDGFRSWELVGRAGVLREDGTVYVEGAVFRQFAPGGRGVAATLESATAILDPNAETASDPGLLRVTGDSFELEGTDWVWLARERTLRLGGGVRTVFRADLAGLLD